MNASYKKVAAAVFSLTALVFWTTASCSNSYPTNPLGLQYDPSNFTNDSSYYAQTGMLIADTCNAGDSHFQSARTAGAEVLEYINPVDILDTPPCAEKVKFYRWSALWPYPTSAPGTRVNYSGSHIGDITVHSAWADAVVDYVENLMISGTVDGVFVDVLGERLWSTLADWTSWSTDEQNAFTDGAVDLVRRLDAARRAINPRFIIVNNNVWYDGVNTRGSPGDWYVDGVCLEHPVVTSSFKQAYAGRSFTNLGHRRMLVIASSSSDVSTWTGIQGVTHISDQQSYSNPDPHPVPFYALSDRASTPQFFGQTSIGPTPSAGLNADYKRGSKFTISQAFTLLGLSAYLDGGGGGTGAQQVLMELYSDASGVPSTRLAVSNTLTINSGQAAGWVHFALPAPVTSLAAGSYWIVIHTGATTGIIRDYGASGGSWYGNSDPFSVSGGSNPFGSGTPGSTTMSVYAVYAP